MGKGNLRDRCSKGGGSDVGRNKGESEEVGEDGLHVERLRS